MSGSGSDSSTGGALRAFGWSTSFLGLAAVGGSAWLAWRYFEATKERLFYGQSKKDDGKTPLLPSRGRRMSRSTNAPPLPMRRRRVAVIQAAVRGYLGRERTERKGRKRKVTKEGLEREIVEAEEKYVQNLKILQQQFKEPIKNHFDSKRKYDPQDFEKIFNNLDSILQLHDSVLEELHSGDMNGWKGPEGKSPAAVLAKYSHMFKIYSHYLIHYDTAVDLLHKYKKNHKSFRKMLEKCRWDTPRGEMKMRRMYQDITSYMIMPCQRIPRYELLLSGLKKNSWPEQDPDSYRLIVEAHARVKAVAHQNDTTQRITENLQYIRDLQERIKGLPISLFSSSRYFLHEGSMRLSIPINAGGIEGGGDSHSAYACTCRVWLFTDLMIWADDSDEYRGSADLGGVMVSQLTELDNTFKILFPKFWHRPYSGGSSPKKAGAVVSWRSPFARGSRSSRSKQERAPFGKDVTVVAEAPNKRETDEWISRIRRGVFDLEEHRSSLERARMRSPVSKSSSTRSEAPSILSNSAKSMDASS